MTERDPRPDGGRAADRQATGPSGQIPPISDAGELRAMLDDLAERADSDGMERAYDRASRFAAALELREARRPRAVVTPIVAGLAAGAFVAGIGLTAVVGPANALGVFAIVAAALVVYGSVMR